MTGTSFSVSAKGRVIGPNRASPSKGGVRPPWANRRCAIRTVIPDATKFSATPEISWFPRKVIDATPCIPASISEASIPANSPAQTDPVRNATEAEAIAAISILPSSPMSKIPARSEYSPARQAKSKGVARRMVESRICRSVA